MSRTLFLCGGLQSSGSTLVSWCFLQRPDMDGVLDGDNDILPALPPDLGTPFAWYKTTICCFRLSEIIEYFETCGWQVRPLLVVRDVRHVWASLVKKPYGCNGTTAEDPPMRLRMRRFREDWEFARHQCWPQLCYESFVAQPEPVLRNLCERLALPWDDAMITWPKPTEAVFNIRHGNVTFRATRRGVLHDTIRRDSTGFRADLIAAGDLAWLEKEFREFNQANSYPLCVIDTASLLDSDARLVPTYEVTRRYKWELRRKPLRWLQEKLGMRTQRP